MADDARISTAIRNHPKTRKLQKRLGRDAVLSLIWLFLYAAESRPDGNLDGMTDEDIELACDWTGKDGEFVAALVDVRFLDGDPDAYRIHDWEVHNPWAASRGRRQAIAQHAANVRWAKIEQGLEMHNACLEHADSMQQPQNSNAHHPTQPNTTNKTSSSEPSSDKQDYSKQPSQEACKLSQFFKTEILNNKPDFKITEAQLRKWSVTADRMINLDKREPRRIAELMRWVQRDEFWMANCLSMDTLRKKFDQLELKKNIGNNNGRASPEVGVSLKNPADEMRRQLEAD